MKNNSNNDTNSGKQSPFRQVSISLNCTGCTIHSQYPAVIKKYLKRLDSTNSQHSVSTTQPFKEQPGGSKVRCIDLRELDKSRQHRRAITFADIKMREKKEQQRRQLHVGLERQGRVLASLLAANQNGGEKHTPMQPLFYSRWESLKDLVEVTPLASKNNSPGATMALLQLKIPATSITSQNIRIKRKLRKRQHLLSEGALNESISGKFEVSGSEIKFNDDVFPKRAIETTDAKRRTHTRWNSVPFRYDPKTTSYQPKKSNLPLNSSEKLHDPHNDISPWDG